MSTAKVIIDSNSLQAQAHLIDKLRLRTFIEAIRKVTSDVEIKPESPQHLNIDKLSNYDLLIITTRSPYNTPYIYRFPYNICELSDIPKFVDQGGSLLLMSDHSDTSQGGRDMRAEDNRLAKEFNVKLDRTFFTINDTLTGLTNFDNPSHPIVSGIDTIVVNNCCSISERKGVLVNEGTPLVFLNESMEDIGPNHENARGKVFAYAIDKKRTQNGTYSGRVVIVADSGFIGETLTQRPGKGLINCGDNYQFVVNMISWLLQ